MSEPQSPLNFKHTSRQSSLDFAGLPPFLRVLLSTDGTVTKSLEAYFWEKVEVQTLTQQYEPCAQALLNLGLAEGDGVLVRKVQLKGATTGAIYVAAESYVRPEVLPLSVRQGLEKGTVGIGELLRECGLETYRKVLEYGLDDNSNSPSVWRTYVISMAQTPFIQITERFVLAHF